MTLDGHFCTSHWCGTSCDGCMSCSPAARVLYLHTEKTGGTSVECATQRTLVAAGLWTNMGHAEMWAVQRCIAACPGRESIIVLSVREPYSYWRSVYRYAVRGVATAVHPPLWAQANITAFVAWAAPHERAKQVAKKQSQTARVQRACGDPCAYDLLLRTETLERDWENMLRILQLPPMTLPRLNANPLGGETHVGTGIDGATQTASRLQAGAAGPDSKLAFTAEAIVLINEMESWLFETFGYDQLPLT